MIVEPSRLDEPLPGGRTGATVRVHPLLAGEMLVSWSGIERPPGRLGALRGHLHNLIRANTVHIPIPAFLIEHPHAGAVMVDTGFHPVVTTAPTANLGFAARAVGPVRTSGEQTPRRLLAAHGLTVDDIHAVLMTHLHFDHASALSEFPAAAVVVDEQELTAARRPGRLVRGYSRRQLDGHVQWRTVDYSDPNAKPFRAFSRTVDVFGDGSVRLVSTPGHTAGHQSVLLRLATGEVLLTGDAAYTSRTITGGALPLMAADLRKFKDSLAQIARYVADDPHAIVVPGHDPRTWSTVVAALAEAT